VKETDMPSGGATTAPYTPRPADDPTYNVDPGRGWVLFAGIMFMVIGVLNVVYGIAAISDSKFYVRDVEYVIGNLHTWGWALTIVGIIQLVVAVGIWRNSEAARWAGVVLASANMIVQFLVLPAYPAWAIMVFFVDVIVIFGLVRYGGRDRYSLS
jgi:hypothetical protein